MTFLVSYQQGKREEFDLTIGKSCIRTKPTAKITISTSKVSLSVTRAFYLTISLQPLNQSLSKCQTECCGLPSFSSWCQWESCRNVPFKQCPRYPTKTTYFTKTFESFSKFNTRSQPPPTTALRFKCLLLIFQFSIASSAFWYNLTSEKIFKSYFNYAVTRERFQLASGGMIGVDPVTKNQFRMILCVLSINFRCYHFVVIVSEKEQGEFMWTFAPLLIFSFVRIEKTFRTIVCFHHVQSAIPHQGEWNVWFWSRNYNFISFRSIPNIVLIQAVPAWLAP